MHLRTAHEIPSPDVAAILHQVRGLELVDQLDMAEVPPRDERREERDRRPDVVPGTTPSDGEHPADAHEQKRPDPRPRAHERAKPVRDRRPDDVLARRRVSVADEAEQQDQAEREKDDPRNVVGQSRVRPLPPRASSRGGTGTTGSGFRRGRGHCPLFYQERRPANVCQRTGCAPIIKIQPISDVLESETSQRAHQHQAIFPSRRNPEDFRSASTPERPEEVRPFGRR